MLTIMFKNLLKSILMSYNSLHVATELVRTTFWRTGYYNEDKRPGGKDRDGGPERRPCLQSNDVPPVQNRTG